MWKDASVVAVPLMTDILNGFRNETSGGDTEPGQEATFTVVSDLPSARQVLLGFNFDRHVTKFAPHKALKLTV